MSTSLEEMHNIPLHIRVGRARAAVIMFILSDALTVLAILAAGGYLSALDVLNQYRLPGDHPPALLPGILVAIALVLSALTYFGWERSERQNEGAGQSAFFIIAWVLMILASAVQIYAGVTLGYASPFHAYESVLVILTWYSAAHLVLAAIIGLLLLGRIMRGRLVGHGYIAEVVGYWWYYTIIASLLMWLFALLLV